MTLPATDRKAGLRWHLREATSTLHRQADALGTGHDLRSRTGYGAFLAAHALALPGLEAAVAAALPKGAIPDWPQRSRAAAVRADLAALGLPWPPPLPVPPFASAAAALGAAYVLEGSRLGNAMLLKTVRSGPALAETGADTYLSHQPGGESWPGFLARLENALPDPDDWPEAAAGACRAFAIFLDAFRSRMGPLPDRAEYAAHG